MERKKVGCRLLIKSKEELDCDLFLNILFAAHDNSSLTVGSFNSCYGAVHVPKETNGVDGQQAFLLCNAVTARM